MRMIVYYILLYCQIIILENEIKYILYIHMYQYILYIYLFSLGITVINRNVNTLSYAL